METIFSQPLHQRIDVITRWIDECTNKELEHILPALVDSLFGISSGIGWGLRNIQYNTFPLEYDLILKFLHPLGPVFCLCYKLLSDTYLKYDYQLNLLPVKLKQLIDEGIAPSFYMDKIRYDHKTRQPIVLSLNPFEYYMFHFVFHLVNPSLEINSQEMNLNLQWPTLYLKLAEQYMLVFLPLDGSPVHPLTTHYMLQSPARSLSIHTPNKPTRTPTLFKPDVLIKHSTTVHSTTQTAPHLEIWRSQLLVQLCIEFWLSVPGSDNVWFSRTHPPWSRPFHPFLHEQQPVSKAWFNRPTQPWPSSPTSLSQQKQFQSYTPSNESWFNQPSTQAWTPSPSPLFTERQPVKLSSQCIPPLWPQQTLPTGEHIRVVRYLIKHLHYFANSQVQDSTAMDELKRIIIPSSQNKIYRFLRETMQHWPLDASFRLILETWLSYIQPWRYTEYRMIMWQERDERSVVIDQRWLPFIAENLLAYTFVFQQLLSRFSRLDLSTPRNALMLFRVSKIFAQPNLSNLLKEIENSLVDAEGRPGCSKWASIVRTQIMELEGPGFQYSPLFCEQVESKVTSFLEVIQQAEIVSKKRLDDETESKSTYNNSIFRWLFSYQFDTEYSYDERKKVPVFLESSFYNLAAVFNLDENLIRETSKANISPQRNVLNESSMERTPEEMQKRLLDMKYQGDPDLKPIQSFEVMCLVRLLYHVTSWINFVYGQEIRDLYTRNNLIGGLARQILWGPTTIFYFDKSIPGYSPRKSTTLPPRLSLRYWANKRLLSFIVIMSIIVKFVFGIPVVLAWCVVLFLWIIYLLCNILIGRVPPIPNLNDITDISMFN